MMPAGPLNRTAMLDKIASEPEFDVAVIGGGATGLGTALDAVSRGLKTIVLEADDFAKGTSSRSTKLIHGGVRYLRSGQVKMVYESLAERGRLEHNAPHIVRTIPFVIPSYQLGKRWFFFIGMKLYDFLAGKLFSPAASRLLTTEEVAQLVPTLNLENLQGGVLYSDGQFDDSRLAFALARETAAGGGVVLNHAQVDALTSTHRKLDGLKFIDRLSGQEHSVRAKTIVNATGVFGRSIMALDPSTERDAPTIVPSRGTHVVIDEEFMPGETALLIPDTDDGRVLFAIPWLGKTVIGTTDVQTDNICPDPKPTKSEVVYILDHVGRYLTRQPALEDVRSVFSGLRPLVGKANNTGGTASLSREHEIYISPKGLITIIGGKWTTYRKMGEDVIDLAIDVGRLMRNASRTAYMRLDALEESASAGDYANYGGLAKSIEAMVAEEPELSEKLHPSLPYQRAHVRWAVEEEMACTLDDVLSRRLRALLMDARAAIECCPAVAEQMADLLHKDKPWIDEQVEQYTRIAEGYLPDALD